MEDPRSDPRLVEALKAQQGQLTDEEWEEMDREILARISSAVAYAKGERLSKAGSGTRRRLQHGK